MADNNVILVAEDDEFLSKIYEVKLEKESYVVIKAMDGEQAISLVKSKKPDLILLDLIMPKKSGFEVLRELKLDSELKDIPVIILTNLGQDEDVTKGLEMGANDYVVKANTTIEEVMEKIATYI